MSHRKIFKGILFSMLILSISVFGFGCAKKKKVTPKPKPQASPADTSGRLTPDSGAGGEVTTPTPTDKTGDADIDKILDDLNKLENGSGDTKEATDEDIDNF